MEGNDSCESKENRINSACNNHGGSHDSAYAAKCLLLNQVKTWFFVCLKIDGYKRDEHLQVGRDIDEG